MTTSYIIISLIFSAFTYLISRENANGVGKSVLLGVVLMLFWPILLTFGTVYLIIGHIRRSRNNEEVDIENLSPSSVTFPKKDYENLKAALSEEGGKSSEEIVEEQVNQTWEEMGS